MIKIKRGIKNVKGLRSFAILALGGVSVGFCNGLLGAGGGIIAVLVLSEFLGKDGESRRSVYANALCVTVFLSAVSLISYGIRGEIPTNVESRSLAAMLAGGAAGGVVGGILTGKLKYRALDRLFAALTVLSGLLLLMK